MFKNVLLVCLSTFLTFFSLELLVRTLHSNKHEMTFWYDIEEEIYRSFSVIKKTYDPKNKNILLVGGSVLDSAVDSFRAAYKSDPKVKFYDISAAAHSSRDAFLKLNYLAQKGFLFDHIVFYHGINEARANNIAPDRFRADYSHYFYYSQINPAFDVERPILGLFLKSALFIKAYQSFFYYLYKNDKELFVPPHNPRPEWVKYGGEINSVDSFRSNLEGVINAADKMKAHLIIPRFASYIAKNYDGEKLKNNELGYAKHDDAKYFLLAEVWGRPDHVKKAVLFHNRVIEDPKYQSRYTYLDTSYMDRQNLYFVDPCHFSVKGIDEFVSIVSSALL